MCGFFGKFSSERNNNQYTINKVSLSHRGPDSNKNFKDDYFYGEFFRLNIIGGKSADQPMFSYDKKFLMLFNGEIYNYLEIAKEYNISAKEGDSRVAIELIAKFGLKIISKFNGMFAIVIYDRKKNKTYLIRDRLGTKPLYYSKKQNSIYFASEIKALPVKKNIDSDIVSDYLDFGKYPKIKSFFKKIYNVPPSSIIEISKNEFNIKKYFDIKKEVLQKSRTKFDKGKFNELLKNAILIRQRSDKKINFHLSGGIDSTSLLIFTKDNWSSKYKINSSSFSYYGYKDDEYKFIKNISKKLRIKNNKVTLYPNEVPQLAEKLQYFQDEPYGGLASIAEFKLNLEEKKNGEIVSFEGMGGDEILGGYNSHFLMALNEMIKKSKKDKKIAAMKSYLGLTTNQVRKKSKKLIQSEFNASTDLSDFRSINKKYNDNYEKNDWFKKIMFYDILESKIPRTLRFRDRISSACSRELRFPFLDHELLTYSMAAPFDFKFKNGLPKFPLRKIVKKYFNRDFNHKKRSISAPQTIWLQGPLLDWVQDNIRSLELKSVIEKKHIARARKMINQKIDNSFLIWQLINLNLFYENTKYQNIFLNDKK
tara:strand:- start:325 stop:2103 length:1779 start_codon:yes stop_codon:yes gene_type:complete